MFHVRVCLSFRGCHKFRLSKMLTSFCGNNSPSCGNGQTAIIDKTQKISSDRILEGVNLEIRSHLLTYFILLPNFEYIRYCKNTKTDKSIIISTTIKN